MTDKKPIIICIPTTPERHPKLLRLIESITEHVKIPYRVLFYPNTDGGWVKACHNLLSGLGDSVVFILGDDTKVEADCVETLYEEWKKAFPEEDGLAQPYDEINHGRLCQHPMGRASVILKYMFDEFFHNFSDNDLTDMILAENKYIYVPEARIEHLHVVNKKAEMDETYKGIFNREKWAKDQALYVKRSAERAQGIFINNENKHGTV